MSNSNDPLPILPGEWEFNLPINEDTEDLVTKLIRQSFIDGQSKMDVSVSVPNPDGMHYSVGLGHLRSAVAHVVSGAYGMTGYWDWPAMTEERWLKCADPRRMIQVVSNPGLAPNQPRRRVATDRQLVLFACACRRAIRQYDESWSLNYLGGWAQTELHGRIADGGPAVSRMPYMFLNDYDYGRPDFSQEVAVGLARCIFGNPWKSHNRLPLYDDPTVQAIAGKVYDERRWEELPILTDALEDVGCTNEEVLGHLRGGGPHARGCWVIDLIHGRV